jgi:mono/diheme cytochrome c family protein
MKRPVPFPHLFHCPRPNSPPAQQLLPKIPFPVWIILDLAGCTATKFQVNPFPGVWGLVIKLLLTVSAEEHMKSTLCIPRLGHRLLSLVGLGLLLLAGCADRYSDAVVYKIRQDPLFPEKEIPTKELDLPDQPGVFPLMSMASLTEPDNPYLVVPEQEKSKLIDPTKISEEDKMSLKDALDKIFGSPQEPQVVLTSSEKGMIADLQLSRSTLKAGSDVYRVQCMQCHGVAGDGRGYSARWLNPHPRDYRIGLFKFQSVDQTDGLDWKPLREDLYRTIDQGIEGTSMPAFNMLKSDEKDALVSYVIHLSIRGEAETKLFRTMERDQDTGALKISDVMKGIAEGKKNVIRANVQKFGKDALQKWADSQKTPIKVAAYPYAKKDGESDAEHRKRMKQSVLRGQALFAKDWELYKEYMPREEHEKNYGSLTPLVIDAQKKKLEELFAAKYNPNAFATLLSLQNQPLATTAFSSYFAMSPKDFLEDYYASLGDSSLQGEPLLKKSSDQLGTKLHEYLTKEQAAIFYSGVQVKVYDNAMTAMVNKVNCAQCHLDYGRQAKWKFDEWGTLVKPRDMTLGLYRGGRRPVDIYFRVHSGINGSNMLRFGKELHGDQLSDLDNYVQAVPYAGMRNTYGIQLNGHGH